MVAVLLLAGGCAFVTSPAIVGETPLNIESVRSEWEGTWLADGDPVLVKVLDGTNGVLQVGWRIEDDSGNMKLELTSVYLRKYGDWTFATLVPLDESGQKEPYVWFKMVKDKRLCLLWLPDTDKFQALVDAGILPGEATSRRPIGPNEGRKKTGVKLGALKPKHLALIASETHGVLFAWEAPLFLFKTGE